MSIFFQLSKSDFVEAFKYRDGRDQYFNLRIISFQGGREFFIYLPDVTLSELSVFASILRLRIIPDFRHLDDLRSYLYNISHRRY